MTKVPLVSGISMIYSQALTACLGIYLARYLGADLYGLVNLARNLLIIALVLTPIGLDLALQRHLSKAGGDIETARAEIAWLRIFAIVVSLVLTLVLFAGGADWLEASVFRFPDFAKVFTVTMAALPFGTDLAVLGGAYRGIYRPIPSLTATYLVQPSVRAIAVLLLLFSGLSVWAVVWGTLLGFIASWVYLAIKADFDFAWRGRPLIKVTASAFQVLRYAPVLGLSTLIFTIARSLDTIALGYWASSGDVGRYAAVLMVTLLVGIVGSSLGQTLGTSVAAASHAGDTGKMAALLRGNMELASILCAPFCVVIAIWGQDIDLLLGPSYVIDRSVFVVAAAMQWLMAVTHYSSSALSLTGRHRVELFNNVLALAVQSAACFLLVPRFGLIGAATASLISIFVINVARQIEIAEIVGFMIVGPRLFFPLLVALIAAVPLVFVGQAAGIRTWWLTGLLAGVHVTLYCGTVFAFLLTPEQRKQLRHYVKRP
jgi:O-antigen/teichoic acid export membrane protein